MENPNMALFDEVTEALWRRHDDLVSRGELEDIEISGRKYALWAVNIAVGDKFEEMAKINKDCKILYEERKRLALVCFCSIDK